MYYIWFFNATDPYKCCEASSGENEAESAEDIGVFEQRSCAKLDETLIRLSGRWRARL